MICTIILVILIIDINNVMFIIKNVVNICVFCNVSRGTLLNFEKIGAKYVQKLKNCNVKCTKNKK
jgi:hypothetical protein